MAYHITLITNQSGTLAANVNPAASRDDALIANGAKYVPERPILINKGVAGTYGSAFGFANLVFDNNWIALWDNGNDGINYITPAMQYPQQVFTGPATNVVVSLNNNGSPLTITEAS
jgi:hypothetical protein